MSNPTYWFPAKFYGWGWGFPSAWQGWVVLGAYVLLMITGALLIDVETNLVGFLTYIALLSVALIGIAHWKGEPTRWRWGKDDE